MVLFSKSHSPLIVIVSADRLRNQFVWSFDTTKYSLESLILMTWASLKLLDNQHLKHHVCSLISISELWLKMRTTHTVHLGFLKVWLHGRKNGRCTWLLCCLLMSLLAVQLLVSWNWTVWLGLQRHKDNWKGLNFFCEKKYISWTNYFYILSQSSIKICFLSRMVGMKGCFTKL